MKKPFREFTLNGFFMDQPYLFVKNHPVDKLVDPAFLRLDFVLDILQHALVLLGKRVFRSNLVRCEDNDNLRCFLDIYLMPECIAQKRYGSEDWNAVIALGDGILPQS